MAGKIRLYHFNNGNGGGVFSVIKNLIQFSENDAIENHLVYTINKDITANYIPNPVPGALSEQVFYYSPRWNFYYTCKQLAALLPDDNAIVIAHDWMELGMMSNLGLQNPAVQFLHGDYPYYYELAKRNEGAVDLFIPVAHNIATKLLQLLPNRQQDIAYLRFPVASVLFKESDKKESIDIIFIGRLSVAKGYTLLPLIAEKMQHMITGVRWHIVGTHEHGNVLDVEWDKHVEVHFYNQISNADVLRLLPAMNFLILPSLAEGMPVVVIEAMKAGVIPIVNNIDGGLQELVIDNETGFKIKNNSVNEYADTICALIKNEKLAAEMRKKCVSVASKLFDPYVNTKEFEDKIWNLTGTKKRIKHAVKAYGSRLDQPWIANTITNAYRAKLKKS